MVLSACSPYFQSMLYNTPDRHPIVFLRDVRYNEMKALLEFMYRGEVSVDQENLSSLLKVAEGLKIKGLAEVTDTAPSTVPRLPLMPHPLLSSPLHHHMSHMDSLSSSSPMKRMASPPSTSSLSTASSANTGYIGPKRKRAKPRRLSGSEAVPLASGLAEAVEAARCQQRAQEQAEAVAVAVAHAAAAAAVAASVMKKDDEAEGLTLLRDGGAAARGEREENISADTKLDGVCI
jgi:hypothetical protein